MQERKGPSDIIHLPLCIYVGASQSGELSHAWLDIIKLERLSKSCSPKINCKWNNGQTESSSARSAFCLFSDPRTQKVGLNPSDISIYDRSDSFHFADLNFSGLLVDQC